MLSNKDWESLTTLLVCAWPRRNTGWKPGGSSVNGSGGLSACAASSSATVTTRLSRATRLKKFVEARLLLLQRASELRLIGTEIGTPPDTNRGQVVAPTVERNGWSSKNSLEND